MSTTFNESTVFLIKIASKDVLFYTATKQVNKIYKSWGSYRKSPVSGEYVPENHGKYKSMSDKLTHEFIKLISDKINDGYKQLDNYMTYEQFIEYVNNNKLLDTINITTDKNGNVKPQLAKPFKANVIKGLRIVQDKINGVRALPQLKSSDGIDLFSSGDFVCRITSREGITYRVPHLEDLLRTLLVIAEDEIGRHVVLDGELYIDKASVTTIAGAAKNQNNDLHSELVFKWYDIAISDMDNNKRDYYRKLIFDKFAAYNTDKKIVLIESLYLNSDSETVDYGNKRIDAGEEGIIIRNPYATYTFGGRDNRMMKFKRVYDGEFKLIDIISSGKDKYRGEPIAMFVCKNDINDLVFNVTPEAGKELRREYYIKQHELIGKSITVTYRERTDKGLPFHANGIIRDYE
jgi:hypothetical protein